MKKKFIIPAILIVLLLASVVGYNLYLQEDKDYEKTSQYVEMSDGTKLAVDVYMPDGISEDNSLPVIFQYTPYGRAFVIPDLKWYEKPFYKNAIGTGGPVLDRANSFGTVYGSSREQIREFLSEGYIYVVADMRGTGASYGTKTDFSPYFGEDGLELINWIGKQAWSNGNVGMFGGSYLGYSQLVTGAKAPEALKCIFPEVVPLDGYSGEIRPGGTLLWAYSQNDMQVTMEQNQYLPDEGYYPTAPVIDEDGDGNLADEIPIDANGNGSFLDDYNYPDDLDNPPQYTDGNERDHIYYLATREHLTNVPYNQVGPNTQFIDTEWNYGVGDTSEILTSYDVGPSSAVKGLMESGIAIYNHGGWFDPFARGSFELYETMKETNPSKIIMDAGYHEHYSPYWEYFGENEEEMLDVYKSEMLRFFDFYLKGIQNGIDTDPPILLYNMNGDGWRTENEWPLARQELTEYFFTENGILDKQNTGSGNDLYTVNFEHDARWGSWPTSRWQLYHPDEMPIRTELDKLCLTYTGNPLTNDTEVTGHPIVDLWVSSTADNGDFYIYLEDVDENGNAVLVTEGVLRAGFSEQYDNDTMIQAGAFDIEVLPELPWSGYEEAQYNEKVFATGKIIHLTIDLQPTSWVFNTGHSIRVSIAGSDFPTFAITPELSTTNDPNDPNNTVPVITIYRSEEYPSGITLPIIPR
jgi:putative CocE/NonD family hydrolase